jgi:hypothetical protein
MTKENTMGLRQQVKKGIVTLDEAIEIAKDYNESIQRWLKRRKDAGILFVPDADTKPKKNAKKKKKKTNASV